MLEASKGFHRTDTGLPATRLVISPDVQLLGPSALSLKVDNPEP